MLLPVLAVLSAIGPLSVQGESTVTPVTAIFSAPCHMCTDVRADEKIVLKFSVAMGQQSVETAFSIMPSVEGHFNWLATGIFEFVPHEDFEENSTYAICISADTASASDERPLDGNANGVAEGSPIDDVAWSFKAGGKPNPPGPPPLPHDPWPQFQRDHKNSGRYLQSAKYKGTTPTYFDDSGWVSGTPVVSDGTVFVVSHNQWVYALDEETLQIKWKKTYWYPGYCRLHVTPAISTDGKFLYIGCHYFVSKFVAIVQVYAKDGSMHSGMMCWGTMKGPLVYVPGNVWTNGKDRLYIVMYSWSDSYKRMYLLANEPDESHIIIYGNTWNQYMVYVDYPTPSTPISMSTTSASALIWAVDGRLFQIDESDGSWITGYFLEGLTYGSPSANSVGDVFVQGGHKIQAFTLIDGQITPKWNSVALAGRFMSTPTSGYTSGNVYVAVHNGALGSGGHATFYRLDSDDGDIVWSKAVIDYYHPEVQGSQRYPSPAVSGQFILFQTVGDDGTGTVGSFWQIHKNGVNPESWASEYQMTESPFALHRQGGTDRMFFGTEVGLTSVVLSPPS
ncbi:MAG: PQQ-binding-like beta-propeller repeat protein [Thermoplasmata archaeon]|nr:PQQ-binding-like beta-propeller repeat protein [Thermoplasmata archaeon]